MEYTKGKEQWQQLAYSDASGYDLKVINKIDKYFFMPIAYKINLS